MRLEELGLIGNCQFSAHVHSSGAIVWCCLPRFDAEPVFSSLLDTDSGGHFSIGPADGSLGAQRYLDNTNVLETRFTTADGVFRVLDFAPRFLLYERHFRPTKLVRIVEPLIGTPRVRVACEPRLGWSKRAPARDQGSHHVSYAGFEAEVRLTTDVPLSYLGAASFALTAKRHFIFSFGAPVEEPLEPLCDRFLTQTVRYWQRWVKHCDVPPWYQAEVIRSALTLKLHCFEDTGAIVAAMTTSVPEAAGSGRTWDYRYCWLRDAYYALDAFRWLGCFQEREQFLHYLLNVASAAPGLDLAPLYRIDGSSDISERTLADWPGFEQEGPVRVGNQAAEHRQNDIYGELVLALAPLFLDERFRHDLLPPAKDLIVRLARKAISVAGQPDAGIWEYRENWRPQTFSSLMSWAAADRLAKLSMRHGIADSREFEKAAQDIRAQILMRAWSPKHNALVASYDGDNLDAAMLQAVTLRLLPAADPRAHTLVDAIRSRLGRNDWLLRYVDDDGFGETRNAFVICTFWLVQALAVLGRDDEARATLSKVLGAFPPLGLIAEDVDPLSGRMWGNFPQAYSHVGLIHAAFAASPAWDEVQ